MAKRHPPNSGHPAPASVPVKPAPAARGASARPAATPPAVWVALIILGLAARVAVAATTWGSNDVLGFQIFGLQISQFGLFEAYRQNPELNHPPIPALWAALSYRLADPTPDGGGVLAFCFLLKLPGLAAEAVSVWLLWRIGSARGGCGSGNRTADGGGRTAGFRDAALYAWALAPLLVAGYHGNTDTVYAMLSLLAVYLLEGGGREGDGTPRYGRARVGQSPAAPRPLAAGLALAAAVNVKLIPVLLVPPLLLSLRSRRDAARFLAGLAVGVVPFLPLLAAVGPAFYRNALAYDPKPDRWGLMLPLLWNRELPLDPAADRVVLAYKAVGRYVILGLVTGWAVLARLRGRTSRYELAAATYAVFLVFTPGFGAQYVAVVAPLLAAARPAAGLAYSTMAGLCVLLMYYLAWDGQFPPGSLILGYVRPAPVLFGLAAWAVLAGYLVAAVRRAVRATPMSPASPPPHRQPVG
ncbi:MAG: rane protein [Phycisphaerales bacterium]|nr:rane protein [Phycisphaerales bacterium]